MAPWDFSTGLHQWNLMVEDGRLMVWNPQERHDMEEVLDGAAKIEMAKLGDERWHEVVLRE